MRPRRRSRYEQMLGYLVRLRQHDRVPWPKAIAWAIAAYRCPFANDPAYLAMVMALEADARAEIRRRARDRQRTRVNHPGLTLPPALHRLLDRMAALPPSVTDHLRWQEIMTDRGQPRQRPPIARPPRRRPPPEPAPIGARVVAKALKPATDSQSPAEQPLHLAMLADTVNGRRL